MKTTPLLLTHWDPDVYPPQPVPLLQELLVHILAHGEVWLKEVDLFLNRRIRAFLSNQQNRDVFTSLVDTQRVKLLVPDLSTTLDLDRFNHPLLATARSRSNRKPLKSKPWKLTEEVEQFCARMDFVFGRAGREFRSSPGAVSLKNTFCRPRVTPPSGENQFAIKLHDVLTQRDKLWKRREQFRGITRTMAREFQTFCEDHEIALRRIVAAGEKPNAEDGFYRSLAYQCAELFPAPGRQAMKNLAQSVYAYCELNREEAAGTYSGARLAEMPPDRETTEEIVRVEIVPLDNPINISMIPNIGEVVSAVLEECESSLRVFRKLVGKAEVPHRDFQSAWDRVAQSFAKHGAKYARLSVRPSKGRLRQVTDIVLNCATLYAQSTHPEGAVWTQDVFRPIDEMNPIATLGFALLDSLRTGRMRLRKKLRNELNSAAGIRCSRIT